MASGDFVVTLSLTGSKAGGDSIESFSESFTKSSIADEFNREIAVPTSLTTIFTPGTLGAAGLATLNGIIIWNDDATNFIRVGVLAAGDATYHKVPAKRFLVLWSDQFDTTTGGAFGAFVSATTINAIADTAACVVKVRAF